MPAPAPRAPGPPSPPAPRDDAPRRDRLGPIRLGVGADLSASTEFVPHAVTRATWADVPPRLAAEVTERAAVHNVRGLLPDEAVRRALEQALEDEAEAEAEFDWAVARSIVRAFPAPFRNVDHRPSPDVLRMAAVVERLCQAELSEPGAAAGHRAYFERFGDAFGLSAGVVDAVSAAFAARLAELRRLAPPLDEPGRDGEGPTGPGQAMFGMETEYDGLLGP